MDREFNKKIGKMISEKRKDKRWTQVELAARLDIAKSTLSCYEVGLRGVDLDVFFKICRLLEFDPNDVFRFL